MHLLKILTFLFLYLNNVQQSTAEKSFENNSYKLFQKPVTFNVDSTVQIDDVATTDKEVGFKIKCTLNVEPIWKQTDSNDEYIIKFNVKDAKVWAKDLAQLSSPRERASSLSEVSWSPWLVHWCNGSILSLHANHNDDVHTLNYKKSLSSVFQFQTEESEFNETDVSGDCQVHYERLSNDTLRKTKRGCEWKDGTDMHGSVHSTRLTRYTLDLEDQVLREIFAEELHVMKPYPQAPHGLKARVWLKLIVDHVGKASDLSTQRVSLEQFLEKMQPLKQHSLAPTSVPPLEEDAEDKVESLSLVAQQHRSGLEALAGAEPASGGGDAGGAGGAGGAAVRGAEAAVRALRREGGAAGLARLMEDPNNHDILAALARCAGAAGTEEARAALAAALKPDAPAHRRLMSQYLAARALAGAGVGPLLAVARGSGPWGRDPRVREAALAAALFAAEGPEAVQARELASRALALCADDACRAPLLRALGNAGSAAAQTLTKYAGLGGRAGLAAVEALRDAKDELLHVALLSAPNTTLETRAAALARALWAAAREASAQGTLLLALPLESAARELSRQRPREAELRRVLWLALAALAEHYEPVRQHRAHLLAFPDLNNWHAQAHSGMSSALLRTMELGEPGKGLSVSLWSLQAALDGALRRSEVVLTANVGGHHQHLLTIDVRTSGLSSLAGGKEPEPGEEEEEVAAELLITAAGAREPAIKLFSGQAELLGHVWSGTGSEPIRATTVLLVPERSVSVPTATGFWLTVHHRTVLLLALSARAQVSLWNRVADTELKLESGVAWTGTFQIGADWVRTVGRVRVESSPGLTVAAALDFYDKSRLCVTASRAPYNVTVESLRKSFVPNRRYRVTRKRIVQSRTEGATLPLDRTTNNVCRDMH